MKRIILTSVLLSVSTVSFAHSDHMKPKEIQIVEESAQNKPEQMGASSVALLETTMELTGGDHGQGRYFSEETTQVEKLVNQGFTMLNMFQYTDAFRSFNTALNLDQSSVISQIGRAFASMSLNSEESYYLLAAKNFLVLNKDALSQKEKAWANLLLAMIVQTDVDGQPLSTATAYSNLQKADSENLEVAVFANWVSGNYDVAALKAALEKDPINAGATHYLLHLGEMRNDHDTALFYGESLAKLSLGSGHGQHMYGHALPHFNRWKEADEQFRIAHEIHWDWAKKNNVHPSEDWHYSHNLDLWSVTNMVLDPAKAVLTLEELEQFSPRYSLDLLDLRVITALNVAKTDEYIKGYEDRAANWKAYVKSSRKLYTLINQADAFETVKREILEGLNWKENPKDNTLFVAVTLINAVRTGDTATEGKALAYITSSLDEQFSQGGFDGWRKSVLETLVYTRIFEVYGLEGAAKALKDKISDVYMNPVD
ncbi:MAG: tetratricopeptide repeat protein [Bdellovibrionales bacterium]